MSQSFCTQIVEPCPASRARHCTACKLPHLPHTHTMAGSDVHPSLPHVLSPHVNSHSTGGGCARCDVVEPANTSVHVQLHYLKTPSKQCSHSDIMEPMRLPSAVALSWHVPRCGSLISSCTTIDHQYRHCHDQGSNDECHEAVSVKRNGTTVCQCTSPFAIHTSYVMQSPSARLTMTPSPRNLRVDIRSPDGKLNAATNNSSSDYATMLDEYSAEPNYTLIQTTLEEPPAPRGAKRCKIVDFNLSNDVKLSPSSAVPLFPALWVNCEAEQLLNHPTEPTAPRHAHFAGRMWSAVATPIVV